MTLNFVNQRIVNFLFAPASNSLNFLVIVRIFTGIILLKHSYILFDVTAMSNIIQFFDNIQIPMPKIMAYISKSTEFFGGILIILGLFTRPIGIILVFNMIVALGTAFGFDIFKGESAFLFLLMFVVFAIIGGGKYSIDKIIASRFASTSTN